MNVVRKRLWPEYIKSNARMLRTNGATFGEIMREIRVPKSTLHEWLKELEKPRRLRFIDQKEFLARIRPLSSKAIRQKREEKVNLMIKEVHRTVDTWNFTCSIGAQKAFLSLLYWAEGQKLPENNAPVKFANTDPRLSLLFITLLRNCYDLNPRKLKILLYLHWYHNEKKVKEFWKQLLGVQDTQFRKIYRKRRSQTKRFRKNSMGICFIIYQSVDLRREIVQTAMALQDKIVKYVVPQ